MQNVGNNKKQDGVVPLSNGNCAVQKVEHSAPFLASHYRQHI
jgi:hypothetical protein